MTIIAILIFMIVLVLLQEFFRRNKWAAWLAFLILPVVLTPWWISLGGHTLFAWIKIYSVVFGVSWILALRYTSLRDRPWAIVIMYLILVLNILEAVFQDIAGGQYFNYMNAITGILLIVTLPGTRAISIDRDSRYNDLLWKIPILWIIGYTIWNLMFIHLFAPEHTLMHIAVLGSALIIGIKNNNLWLQARGITLGTFALLLFTYQPLLEPLVIPEKINEPFAIVGVSIALGLIIIHSVRVFFGSRTKSALEAQT